MAALHTWRTEDVVRTAVHCVKKVPPSWNGMSPEFQNSKWSSTKCCGTIVRCCLELQHAGCQKHCGSSWWALREVRRSFACINRQRIWCQVADVLLDAESYMVNMTDGCQAYDLPHVGIAEHYAVNHTIKEWTRPEALHISKKPIRRI